MIQGKFTKIATALVSIVILGALFAVPVFANTCGGANTSVIDCNSSGGEDAIWELLQTTIGILAAGVGVLALAGIVYGAVLYTSAGGNPEQVKKAKNIFVNVVIGVVAFAGMYVVLEFLIPGGVFN